MWFYLQEVEVDTMEEIVEVAVDTKEEIVEVVVDTKEEIAEVAAAVVVEEVVRKVIGVALTQGNILTSFSWFFRSC